MTSTGGCFSDELGSKNQEMGVFKFGGYWRDRRVDWRMELEGASDLAEELVVG